MRKRQTIFVSADKDMLFIRGRTYLVRDVLKRHGLKFEGSSKMWVGKPRSVEDLLKEIEEAGGFIEMEPINSHPGERDNVLRRTSIEDFALDEELQDLVKDLMRELLSLCRDIREILSKRKEGV